jgi:hypothetical protein
MDLSAANRRCDGSPLIEKDKGGRYKKDRRKKRGYKDDDQVSANGIAENFRKENSG